MVSAAANVLVAALQLTAEERAALAAELIESLDEAEPEEGAEEAWSAEIQRRLAEVDAGTVKPVPWADARQRLLAAAAGRGKAG